MDGALITLVFVLAVMYLAYRRLPLLIYTLTFTLLLAAYLRFGNPGGIWQGTCGCCWRCCGCSTCARCARRSSAVPFLRAYLRLLPTMSSTEREALEAGTVWWDGELFSGKPDWSKLRAIPPPRLSAEEQAFLDGPCDGAVPDAR